MIFGLASFGFCAAFLVVNYFSTERQTTEEFSPVKPKSNWD